MTARIKDSDIEHLSWIYDRLANVHLENTNFDYMHKLNAIIANLKLDYAYYGDLVLHREEVRPVGELIETPEEKEALDEKTYRYEKVELSPKEVFMAMLNGESFYVLKDELIDFDGEQFWRHTSEGKSRITYINHDHEIYRRIEVTERELELEAAYDLYIDSKQSNEPCMSKIIFISTEGREQEFWLRIVRKTGYRKLLNDVNGKG